MDVIRVGRCEIYPAERTLVCAGKPVEIGARAFDMLLVLAENQGRLVTKATLLERVWPRLVVDENNIAVQIASLRRVLDVGAIRTVQGFGYRLEAGAPHPQGTVPAAITAGQPASQSPPRAPLQCRAWPERLGALVGRDDDIRAVREALERSALVTIVGVSGVGKTRLAQEVLAEETAGGGGGAWVSLAAINHGDAVPAAIALALGVPLADGSEGFEALHHAIFDAAVLLIFDGAEHLGDALGPALTRLIMRTRGVRALVTSQAPLGTPGEIVYRLAVLDVPPPGTTSVEEAGKFGAVALFADRATAAERGFVLTAANLALVIDICRRLDGIPLALELAAARVAALGLATVLDRLNDRFRLLRVAGHALDQRHEALHTAFDWSYSLLGASEKNVFDRLGAFPGTFSLKTAAACVADGCIDTSEAMDLIGRLVDRSLVTVAGDDPPRYALLETARYYALEKLMGDGLLEAARRRMAAAVLDLLDVAYQDYWSLDEALWLHRYEPELDNVRSAMDWATRNDPDLGIALFGSSWPLFVETNLYAEGRGRYAQALTLLTDSQPRARIGRFWEAIATYDSTRQCDRARYAAELADAKYAVTGDIRSRYYVLMQLAGNWRVETAAARAAFDAARKLEDPSWPARLLTFGALTAGALLTSAGRFVDARAAYQRAVRLALTTSERQALIATTCIVELDVASGDTDAALRLARPLALSLQHLGRRETQIELLTILFTALLIADEIGEARATGATLFDLATRFDPNKLYMALDAMAFLACKDRRYAAAAQISRCADAAHEAHGQARRRPTEAHLHRAVSEILAACPSPLAPGTDGAAMNEIQACALALGPGAGIGT
jgi:predicted ATPase/DNA-binding winged helix-turn-helix (wHTH) protein